MADDSFKDVLSSILRTKKDALAAGATYTPFGINRALSYYKDTILYANMMNMNHQTPPDLQYQYLLNTVRSMKRPFHNMKRLNNDLKDLESVKLYFGYSNEKAKEALRILSDEQIALIKEKTEKGGVRK
jgi:hypothetical protein